MQYSNIKVGDHVDSVKKPTINYRVLSIGAGWVNVQCMWIKKLAYNVRAKSLVSHDDTVRINRANGTSSAKMFTPTAR